MEIKLINVNKSFLSYISKTQPETLNSKSLIILFESKHCKITQTCILN